MGHSKSIPKREIHSITGLLQETRKVSNKQPNLIPKGIRKRIVNKAQTKLKERNNKNQSTNNIRTKKITKVNETRAGSFKR